LGAPYGNLIARMLNVEPELRYTDCLEVWNVIKDFTFPTKLLSKVIESTVLEHDGGKMEVGAVRKVKWRTGEERRQRLLEISEIYKTIRWELVDSVPESEVNSVISTIRLLRDTERNFTIVEWSCEYSSDCSPQLLQFDQKSLQENLCEMREQLSGQSLPVLYHLHQGPSSRVIWLCGELGIPLNIKEVSPSMNSHDSERSLGKGGIVTKFIDGDLELLESGAILLYLLDKYDKQGCLSPRIGLKERAIFYKFFFYTSSTADHLIFSTYKELFVVPYAQSDQELIKINKTLWEEEVALEFTKELGTKKYICGDYFTAADVMVGWTLLTASLLGWLEGHQILSKYLETLSLRPSFQRAFLSQ